VLAHRAAGVRRHVLDRRRLVADAATMIVLSSAPWSSSRCATSTTVDMRWPMAT